jgi:hypothetical protein
MPALEGRVTPSRSFWVPLGEKLERNFRAGGLMRGAMAHSCGGVWVQSFARSYRRRRRPRSRIVEPDERLIKPRRRGDFPQRPLFQPWRSESLRALAAIARE